MASAAPVDDAAQRQAQHDAIEGLKLDEGDALLPPRPRHPGTLGRPLRAIANVFDINGVAEGEESGIKNIPTYNVHIYRNFRPNQEVPEPGDQTPTPPQYLVTDAIDRRALFFAAVEQHQNIFQDKTGVAFDDGTLVYASSSLAVRLGSDGPCGVSLPVMAQLRKVQGLKQYIVRIKKTNDCAIRVGNCSSLPPAAGQRDSAEGAEERRQTDRIVKTIMEAIHRNPWVKQRRTWLSRPNKILAVPQNPQETESLSGGVEMWYGLKPSVMHQSNGRVGVSMDLTAAAVVRGGIPMRKFIAQIITPRYKYDVKEEEITVAGMTAADWRLVRDVAIGMTFDIRLPGATENYKSGLPFHDFKEPPSIYTFEDGNSTIKLAEYWKRQHNVNLRLPDLPSMHLGKRTKTQCLYPMELIYTTGVAQTLTNKQINGDQQAYMIKASAMPPQERLRRLKSFVRDYVGDAGIARKFGFEIDYRNPLKVAARVLPAPGIAYGGPRPVVAKVDPKGMGDWRAPPNAMFLHAAANIHYSIISLCPQQGRMQISGRQLQMFMQSMTGCAAKVGMRFAEQMPITVPIYMSQFDLKAVKKQFTDLSTAMADKWKAMKPDQSGKKSLSAIMFIIMPAQDEHVYGSIKTIADVEFGIPTQVILSKNMMKIIEKGPTPGNLTAHNLLKKMNFKLGGANFKVDDNNPGAPTNLTNNIWARATGNTSTGERWMALAIDVTHPIMRKQDDFHKPTTVVVTGTTTANMAELSHSSKLLYNCNARTFEFTDLLCERFQKYVTHPSNTKKALPTHVIVYRDTINYGEHERLMDREIKMIKIAAKRVSGGASDYSERLRLVYVVAHKGHNTRFFCENAADGAGRAQNIPAGTLVDKTVVSPVSYEFFLASAGGIQGTTKPTHYRVVYNGAKVAPNELHALTFNLTHISGRCEKSVSYPHVLYWAKIEAERKRLHWSGLKDEHLKRLADIHVARARERADQAIEERDEQRLITTIGECEVLTLAVIGPDAQDETSSESQWSHSYSDDDNMLSKKRSLVAKVDFLLFTRKLRLCQLTTERVHFDKISVSDAQEQYENARAEYKQYYNQEHHRVRDRKAAKASMSPQAWADNRPTRTEGRIAELTTTVHELQAAIDQLESGIRDLGVTPLDAGAPVETHVCAKAEFEAQPQELRQKISSLFHLSDIEMVTNLRKGLRGDRARKLAIEQANLLEKSMRPAAARASGSSNGGNGEAVGKHSDGSSSSAAALTELEKESLARSQARVEELTELGRRILAADEDGHSSTAEAFTKYNNITQECQKHRRIVEHLLSKAAAATRIERALVRGSEVDVSIDITAVRKQRLMNEYQRAKNNETKARQVDMRENCILTEVQTHRRLADRLYNA